HLIFCSFLPSKRNTSTSVGRSTTPTTTCSTLIGCACWKPSFGYFSATTGTPPSTSNLCGGLSPLAVTTTNSTGSAGRPAGSVTSTTTCVSPTLSGFLSGTLALPLPTIFAVILGSAKRTSLASSRSRPRTVNLLVWLGTAANGKTTVTRGKFLGSVF